MAGGSHGEDSDRLLNSCKWHYKLYDDIIMTDVMSVLDTDDDDDDDAPLAL